MNALGKFISEYIGANEISMNELADKVGVSPSTISRHLSKNPPTPDLTFIDQLAQVTGQDPGHLVNLYLGRSGSIPTEVLILARQFISLPPEGKDAIERLIRSYQAKK